MEIANLVDVLDDILQCSVCLDKLRTPKRLPCGHVFCFPCLEPLRSKECPNCRQEFHAVKIADLPTDTTTVKLLETFKHRQRCRDCSSNFAVQCFHCKIKLCESCLKKHMKEVLWARSRFFDENLPEEVRNESDFRVKFLEKVNSSIDAAREKGVNYLNVHYDKVKEIWKERIENFNEFDIEAAQLVHGRCISGSSDCLRAVDLRDLKEIHLQSESMIQVLQSLQVDMDKTFSELIALQWKLNENAEKSMERIQKFIVPKKEENRSDDVSRLVEGSEPEEMSFEESKTALNSSGTKSPDDLTTLSTTKTKELQNLPHTVKRENQTTPQRSSFFKNWKAAAATVSSNSAAKKPNDSPGYIFSPIQGSPSTFSFSPVAAATSNAPSPVFNFNAKIETTSGATGSTSSATSRGVKTEKQTPNQQPQQRYVIRIKRDPIKQRSGFSFDSPADDKTTKQSGSRVSQYREEIRKFKGGGRESQQRTPTSQVVFSAQNQHAAATPIGAGPSNSTQGRNAVTGSQPGSMPPGQLNSRQGKPTTGPGASQPTSQPGQPQNSRQSLPPTSNLGILTTAPLTDLVSNSRPNSVQTQQQNSLQSFPTSGPVNIQPTSLLAQARQTSRQAQPTSAPGQPNSTQEGTNPPTSVPVTNPSTSAPDTNPSTSAPVTSLPTHGAVLNPPTSTLGHSAKVQQSKHPEPDDLKPTQMLTTIQKVYSFEEERFEYWRLKTQDPTQQNDEEDVDQPLHINLYSHRVTGLFNTPTLSFWIYQGPSEYCEPMKFPANDETRTFHEKEADSGESDHGEENVEKESGKQNSPGTEVDVIMTKIEGITPQRTDELLFENAEK